MRYTLTLLSAVVMPGTVAAQAQTRTAFDHAMPALDGAHLTTTIVQVTYAPGAASPAHSHPCPVVGYVLDGSLRTQVRGEPEVVYTAGQTFYEPPNGVHAVSANASATKPVTFLAYFVCDHAGPLSVPAK